MDFTRKGQVEEFGLERKKLQQQMSEISFVTKKESEKRRRLVDKTEKDILKV